MTVDDGYEAGWPPLLPPLLTGHEAAAGGDPMATAVRVAAGGADPGVFVFAGGTEVRTFPTEVLDVFRRHWDTVNAEKSAADPFYARAVASYEAFMASVRGWHDTSEAAWHRYVYGG